MNNPISESKPISAPILSELITHHLIDMGSISQGRFSGVYAPDGISFGGGVTRQFLDDAETYHKKYFDIGYMGSLLDGALQHANVRKDADLILDIGSGSGPSVFALMNRFPNAHIVATDVSPQLLAILRMALTENGNNSRCTTLCLDLNRPWFKGQPFDFAIGSAILHHLFEPHRLIEQVFAVIKPGGILVFFEPFEPGYAMMALIYRLLIAEASKHGGLEENLIHFFKGKINEIAAMKCEPKDETAYAQIDDKWMFTVPYFSAIGERLGAQKTIVYPIHSTNNPFTGQMRTALRLGLGLQPEILPDWGWQLITDIEASTSNLCKQDLIMEGCVAFMK